MWKRVLCGQWNETKWRSSENQMSLCKVCVLRYVVDGGTIIQFGLCRVGEKRGRERRMSMREWR